MPTFSDWAADDLLRLRHLLGHYQSRNDVPQRYYSGKQLMKSLGIAVPPSMANLSMVVGWPALAVDVLEERLNFEGWNDSSLDDLYHENDLDVRGSMTHKDALMVGTSFVTVTAGGDDEPEVVLSGASPNEMVVEQDTRRGLVAQGAHFFDAEPGSGEPNRAILFRPNETVWMTEGSRRWEVESVDTHSLDRVPIAQFVNKTSISDPKGHSEITPSVRDMTDAAQRTLVNAEIAREFYAVPQRWMMGAPESFFLDENGNPRGAWDAMMGKILAVERDEDGQVPQVGSFTAHAMTPFFEQVRHYAHIISQETAIPQTYLGFVTDNPTSADAIRMAENRLVLRAERCQAIFGKAWTEAARLAIMVRDGKRFGELSAEEKRIRPLWRDAATPTKAAAMDQVQKGIAAGVYMPDGDFTMKLLGMSPMDKDMLNRDRARGLQSALLESIRNRSNEPEDPVVEDLVNTRE